MAEGLAVPGAAGPDTATEVTVRVPSVLEDPGLYNRLTYLTAFRLVIVSTLLAATTWGTLRPDDELGGAIAALLYGLIAFIYVASLAYLWLLRAKRLLRSLAYAQVAGDLCVATFLVYLTGGADSLFTLMYPLAIVNAGILLSRNGAVVAAIGAAIAFASLTALLAQGVVAPAASYLEQRPLSTFRFAFIMVANGTAFVLTAALSSYLTGQIRRAGERLSEREVDLAALAELHGSIVQSMSAGIVTTDVHGRITFMNPAAEAITGLTLARLVDEPIRLWFPQLASASEEALAKGLGRGEVDERDARGEARRLSFAVNPLTRQLEQKPGKRDREASLTIVFEDQTALRSMREAVQRADRLSVVGQLAAGLAHEIRNPLASMSGAIELMARGAGLNDAERRLMAIVLREAERLNGLVTDFLAFARPTPLSPQPIDVAALVDETVGVFRHGPSASQLEILRVGPDSVRISADPSQLRQVLWNLLQNAAEAMDGPGLISVEVGLTTGGLCRLSVTDSGPGIPSADLTHLFEPFFTRKSKGTGLGLAWVHRIVEAHGGRIEVMSTPGAGATFTVILPAAQPSA